MMKEQVEMVVNVSPAEAFRFISDPRSELAWNRYAVRIEKTSAGPNAEAAATGASIAEQGPSTLR